ncbi:MAG: HIRAN domain-containing protein [Bacteroidales bacterium]|nr:HIRAN domain-containing protein [Bacteroidales bacterium]
MKKDKVYYTEFHIAGVQYHEAIEVMDQMKVGDMLRLVRDEDNNYDKNAVAIFFGDTHIGYVPRCETEAFCQFLDVGWGDIFEVRLSKKLVDAHPENRLWAVAKILRRKE